LDIDRFTDPIRKLSKVEWLELVDVCVLGQLISKTPVSGIKTFSDQILCLNSQLTFCLWVIL